MYGTLLPTEEMPDFGFSPDATFPIINGEKGILSLHYDIPGGAAEGDYQLLSFDAGLRENMVPQDAHAEVTVPMQKISGPFQQILSCKPS